ncbi:MAG: chemotaxis protein CheA [Bacteroidia bacterium]
MDNLQQVFIDEATEMLETLEKSLLQLEVDPSDPDGIGKVFRVMHTVKGSSGMFGYEAISQLTHQLETIFESIREGQSKLTTEILQVTFQSLDHLGSLLNDPNLENNTLREQQEKLMENIRIVSQNAGTPEAEVSSPGAAAKKYCYYICFSPSENVIRNGNNPLYLIEDLLSLGTGISLPQLGAIPPLDELQPDSTYISFEVILETASSEQEIRDVFMFVSTESTLTVKQIELKEISRTQDLIDKIRALYNPAAQLGFPAIARAAEEITRQVTSEDKKAAEPSLLKSGQSGSSVRVPSERLDELMNLVSELVTTQAQLSLLSNRTGSGELEAISENVEKITRRLRDNAFSMSLIPVESLVVRFQRLVRDLSKELHKEIELQTEGTETEIDKSIIEKLIDPMLHLMRNSLDHGIESPEEREAKGKPRKGTIRLKAFYSGANVVIEISDDGAGIDPEKIKSKAIAKGLISPDTNMEEQEILNLIFLPGFSTADAVTGVSGRGVGMDVVRRNITEIRGDVELSTEKGAGTKFTITLPLTLSIIDGLLVRIGQTDFILPLLAVEKCFEVPTKDLTSTFNSWVTLDGERTPFIFLRKEFGIRNSEPERSQIIRISSGGNKVGLAVDQIIGEYQAVLKPLGSIYTEQDEFSGSSILGDGTVALVLDPNKLTKKITSETIII